MRCLVAAAAWLVSVAAWGVPQGSAEWWDAIDACNAQVEAAWVDDEDVDEILDEPVTLGVVCPSLANDFESHPWRSLLPLSAEQLSVSDAFSLQRLRDEYLNPSDGASTFVSTANLAAILEDLPHRVEEGASWWDRFVNWLDETFGGESGALPEWLQDFTVAEGVFDWILYLSIAAVVILAVGIVLNEIAQHRKGRRRRLDSDPWQVAAAESTPLALNDVRAAPPGLQPGLLLQLIVEQLQQQRLVSLQAGTTHRNVVKATRDLPQQSVIARLAGAAERARYGGWHPDAADVAALTEDGEDALNTLSGGKRQ